MIFKKYYMADRGRWDTDHGGVPPLLSPPTVYIVNQNSIFEIASLVHFTKQKTG